jgi:hypothetical protein
VIKKFVVRLVVLILTNLVPLIIGDEQNGWDGSAWHAAMTPNIA